MRSVPAANEEEEGIENCCEEDEERKEDEVLKQQSISRKVFKEKEGSIGSCEEPQINVGLLQSHIMIESPSPSPSPNNQNSPDSNQ